MITLKFLKISGNIKWKMKKFSFLAVLFFCATALFAEDITYNKTVGEACVIGTRLAASVIASRENVCPRFRPEEFGINVKTE